MTRKIYDVTRQQRFQRDPALARQLQRACVSTMSNIAEGFERSGLKEFNNFLSMAKSSCAEVRCQLYVALDTGSIQEITFRELMSAAQETARVIGGLRSSVARLISHPR
jgi:four helix bundle protein